MFLEHIWWLHGLPDTIVTDCGMQFASGFWQQLCTRLGILLRLSTTFYPETDGQREHVTAVLEQYLQAYISHQQDTWSLWLPLTEFTTNNYESKTTSVTPFFANNGCHLCLNFDITEQRDLLENHDARNMS
jgi:hypothetical protein